MGINISSRLGSVLGSDGNAVIIYMRVVLTITSTTPHTPPILVKVGIRSESVTRGFQVLRNNKL